MFSMKTLVLLMLGATLCLGQLVIAATPSAVSQRVTKLTATLNLTADQQAKAQQIFQNEHQQVLQVLTPAQQQARKTHTNAFHTALKALNLSADQKTKIKAIRQQARTQAEAIRGNTVLTAVSKTSQVRNLHKATHDQILQVLTPDQQSQVQNAVAQAKQQKGLSSLGLSKAQRKQIHQIRKQALADFRAILTTAQQQQFDQLRTERKQGHNTNIAA